MKKMRHSKCTKQTLDRHRPIRRRDFRCSTPILRDAKKQLRKRHPTFLKL